MPCPNQPDLACRAAGVCRAAATAAAAATSAAAMQQALDGFMRFGDTVRMEALDAGGEPLFGAIAQRVVQQRYQPK